MRYKATHGREGFDKDISHIMSREVPSHEDKRSDTCLHEGGTFMRAIPNPSIPGEHHPSPTSDLAQPFLVFGIAAKMVIMDLHVHVCLPQGICHHMSA